MEKPVNKKLTIDDALNALKVIKEFCEMNENSCTNCPFRANNANECALSYDSPNSWNLNETKECIPKLIKI